MQPTPLVAIHGTVMNVRDVVIPAREPTATSKGYGGGQYVEVTLSTDQCHLLGEEVSGLLAYVSVRFDCTDDLLGQLGSGVHLAVLAVPFVDTYMVKGRFANSVGYRYSRLVKLTQPAPKALAHA